MIPGVEEDGCVYVCVQKQSWTMAPPRGLLVGMKGCGGRSGGPGPPTLASLPPPPLPDSFGPLKKQSSLPQRKHESLMVFLCVLKLRCLPVFSLIGLELFMFLF